MIKLIHSDCVAAMKDMPDCSVDSIVTDPPYELGFMGKKWDSTGIAYSVEMWEQCLRVLKPGGHLLAFSGSRTYHRMTVAIEDAGFDIRDQIMWVYGSGFPKSHNLDGDWDGWGTALKPAHEPICVARKPLVGTVAANVLTHGTGALNIDGCRVGSDGGVEFVAGLGRWPANLIHDGSEEVLNEFPNTAPAKAANRGLQHSGRHGGLADIGGNIKEGTDTIRGHNDSGGSAARFFYCAKASKRDRDEGLKGFSLHAATVGNFEAAGRDPENPANYIGGQRARVEAGLPASTLRANIHPTVKPTDLMRYLCRLVTPPNGIVLDPFMGSGSTGKAAKLEGFGFIGIEQNDEYIAIANARIDAAKQQTVETSETLELFA